MGWGKYIVLGLAWLALPALAATHGGLCSYDSTSSPTLPYATCIFPTCPVGANCFPPTIEKSTAQIAYSEPLIRWQDICPDSTVTGACWEVHMDFDLRVTVTSPNGVSYVGVNLSKEIGGQRVRNKYWAKALSKDSTGRFQLTTTLIAYVPPGQRMMLEVHELCAQDATNNQGCIIPLGGQILAN
jgi:hypothetical protein